MSSAANVERLSGEGAPPKKRRVYLVAPGEVVLYLVDLNERLRRGTRLTALAKEIGVPASFLSEKISAAGLEKPFGRGRRRAAPSGDTPAAE